ncbi:MAG: hypothetical protein ACE5KY_05460 [Candidatus Tectimicrobiota bacterium]
MNETNKKMAELEETLAGLRKERLALEAMGCFSDKELTQKLERLEKLSHRIRLLEGEKEKLKTRLRLKPLRG